MTTTINMEPLSAAFNRQSWEWLQDEAPDIAAALVQVMARGASPEDVRRFTMHYTGRAAMAARVEQAAAHLRELAT